MALSFVREVIGHRSQYASGAIGQRGNAEEVGEGDVELFCTDRIVGVTAVIAEESPTRGRGSNETLPLLHLIN